MEKLEELLQQCVSAKKQFLETAYLSKIALDRNIESEKRFREAEKALHEFTNDEVRRRADENKKSEH